MVATMPAPWAVTPGAVDPDWQFLWRDMSLAIPFWWTDSRPQELVKRVDLGSAVQAGRFVAAPEGIAYSNEGTTFYLTTTPSIRDYTLTRNGAWTLFWAMRFDALQAGALPIRFGDGTSQPGHWEIGFNRMAGIFRRVRVRFAGTPGNFFSEWELPTEIPPGYHTFCFSMPGDRESLRFYLDGVDQGVASTNDTADSYVQPTADTEFRMAFVSGNRVDNYSLFVSRDAFVTEAQAVALHNDPWAWVRPAPVDPAVLFRASGTAGSGSGRVPFSASSASARVLASGSADSRPVPPASSATAIAIVGGLGRTALPLPAEGLQGVVQITGSISEILSAARGAANGDTLVSGHMAAQLESPRQAAAGAPFSGASAKSVAEAPGQAVAGQVLASASAVGRAPAPQLDGQGQVVVGGAVSGHPPAVLSSAVVRVVVSAEAIGAVPAARQTAVGFPLSRGSVAHRVAAAVLSVDARAVVRGNAEQQAEAVQQLLTGMGPESGRMATQLHSPRQAAAGRVVFGPTYPARLYVYDDAVVVVEIWDERPPRHSAGPIEGNSS